MHIWVFPDSDGLESGEGVVLAGVPMRSLPSKQNLLVGPDIESAGAHESLEGNELPCEAGVVAWWLATAVGEFRPCSSPKNLLIVVDVTRYQSAG